MPHRLVTAAVQAVDRIVVPVQGSDGEYVAQQWAVELAASLEVPVHAVHVADGAEAMGDDDTWSDTFRFIDDACVKWGVDLMTVVSLGGDVAKELVDELTSRDLVVIGTRKLAGHFHVGSVAAELVRRAPCPVQIVRLDH